jgi:hypothetical protein
MELKQSKYQPFTTKGKEDDSFVMPVHLYGYDSNSRSGI